MKRTLLSLLVCASAVSIAQADPVAPAPAKPSPSSFGSAAENAKTVRRIAIRGKFDNDVIKVQNGVLWIEHAAFEKPTDITVNGLRWKPQWQGNNSERYQFKIPLESFEKAAVEVKKLQGRSELASVQLPTPENKQTLAIKVVDQPVGEDTYEIRIKW